MATYSSNTTIKFSGTQVAVSNSSYVVPAGKTLVGGWAISGGTAGGTISIDSVVIAQASSNGDALAGPLHVAAGSTVTATRSGVSAHAGFHGVLMENTP